MIKPTRILIIDDDLFVTDMYTSVLEQAGYSVNIANNGIDGERELSSGRYDLVLLDLMLPGKMGDELIEEWRRFNPIESRPHIIIITNYEEAEAAQSKLTSEVDGYIIKASTTPRKLRDLVAHILNN